MEEVKGGYAMRKDAENKCGGTCEGEHHAEPMR